VSENWPLDGPSRALNCTLPFESVGPWALVGPCLVWLCQNCFFEKHSAVRGRLRQGKKKRSRDVSPKQPLLSYRRPAPDVSVGGYLVRLSMRVCIFRILYPRELSTRSGRSRLDRSIAGMRSWTAVVNLMLATGWDTGVTASRYDGISAWNSAVCRYYPYSSSFSYRMPVAVRTRWPGCKTEYPLKVETSRKENDELKN
jgi:hypothetical protein